MPTINFCLTKEVSEMLPNEKSEILIIFKDLFCHLEGLNVKCFWLFFLTTPPHEDQKEYRARG